MLVFILEKSQPTFNTKLRLTCLGHDASPSHSFSSANRNCEKESPGNRKKHMTLYQSQRRTLSSLNFPLEGKVLFLKSWPPQTWWYHLIEGPSPHLSTATCALENIVDSCIHCFIQLSTSHHPTHLRNSLTVQACRHGHLPILSIFSSLYNACKETDMYNFGDRQVEKEGENQNWRKAILHWPIIWRLKISLWSEVTNLNHHSKNHLVRMSDAK